MADLPALDSADWSKIETALAFESAHYRANGAFMLADHIEKTLVKVRAHNAPAEHVHVGPICECGAKVQPTTHVCPECEQGKCGNCDGTAWDDAADTETECTCTHGGA